MKRPQAILFDVDGLLITTGGAGAKSWCWAFDELYGIPADIGAFTESGMTDPEVGRLTFEAVIGHEPSAEELARVLSRYLARLPEEVARSAGYRVLDGVEDQLLRLCRDGFLLGITTGAIEAAAHIKLMRANLGRFFSFGGYGSDSSDRGELTRKAIERATAILGSPIDPGRVLVLGDTPSDVTAAHAADAIGVGVASGHYSQEELREAGADYVLGSLEEDLPGTQSDEQGDPPGVNSPLVRLPVPDGSPTASPRTGLRARTGRGKGDQTVQRSRCHDGGLRRGSR